MKIPFSPFLGPYLRKYESEIQTVCAPCLFGSSRYVLAFSFVALILTMLDLFCLIHKDCLTPCFLESLNPKICPSMLKSFKIFSSGINFINYIMLFLGALCGQSVLMMPFLMLQLINIILLSILITVALVEKTYSFNFWIFLVHAFMIHNWMHVFCCFRSEIRFSDF